MPISTGEDAGHSDTLAWQRRALVVVDVVESVRLMQAHEEEVIERWRRFVGGVRQQVLPMHEGQLIKSLGDGLLLSFGSARQAVAAGLQLLDLAESADAAAGVEPSQRLQLRIGLHLADVKIDALDIYGTGVNLAARLAGAARPGELLASAEVADAITPDVDALVDDRGDCFLKHFDEPVRTFSLRREGRRPPAPLAPESLLAARPRLAIVPFETSSAVDADQALGEALADDLIAALSPSPGVTVISRLSSQRLRDDPHRLDTARDHLRADYVLSGRVRVAGTRLRVQAELADTRSAEVLWSGAAQGDVRALFEGSDPAVAEIASAVSGAVVFQQAQRVQALPMPSLDGYTLFMGGRSLLHRFSRPDFHRAEGVLTHLSERVPRCAAPHAMLAKWHIFKMVQGWSENRDWQGRAALDSARRALERDPADALSLAVEGLARTIVHAQLDEAQRRYREAIAVNPNEPYGWAFLSGYLAYREQGQAAIEAADRALALSPLDPSRFLFEAYRAHARLVAGQPAEALACAETSLRHNGMHTPSLRLLILAQVMNGQLAAAQASAARHQQLEPGFTAANYLRRYPGREAPHAQVFAEALCQAGLPP